MSKLFGFALIFAGVGVASTVLPVAPDADHGVSAIADARSVTVTKPRIATMVMAEQPAARAAPSVAPKLPVVTRSAATSAPIIVTVPYRAEPSPNVTRQPPHAPSDRASLARDLQRELRRVGCYSGELNGVWTPATRIAMKAFTERINAVLPVDNPDAILLALVQGHQGASCGKPCPARQGLAEDGRCLPTAILAHMAKKQPPSADLASSRERVPAETPAPAIAGWSTTTVAALTAPPSGPPPEGRMGLAGPTVGASPLVGDVPAGPMDATLGRNKQAEARRPSRRAARHERRDAYREGPRRSRFVESILRTDNTLSRY